MLLYKGPPHMQEKIKFLSDGYEIEGRIEKSSLLKSVVITHPHPLYGGDMHNNVVAAIARVYRLLPTPLKLNLKEVYPFCRYTRATALTTLLCMSPPYSGWGCVMTTPFCRLFFSRRPSISCPSDRNLTLSSMVDPFL